MGANVSAQHHVRVMIRLPQGADDLKAERGCRCRVVGGSRGRSRCRQKSCGRRCSRSGEDRISSGLGHTGMNLRVGDEIPLLKTRAIHRVLITLSACDSLHRCQRSHVFTPLRCAPHHTRREILIPIHFSCTQLMIHQLRPPPPAPLFLLQLRTCVAPNFPSSLACLRNSVCHLLTLKGMNRFGGIRGPRSVQLRCAYADSNAQECEVVYTADWERTQRRRADLGGMQAEQTCRCDI